MANEYFNWNKALEVMRSGGRVTKSQWKNTAYWCMRGKTKRKIFERHIGYGLRRVDEENPDDREWIDSDDWIVWDLPKTMKGQGKELAE